MLIVYELTRPRYANLLNRLVVSGFVHHIAAEGTSALLRTCSSMNHVLPNCALTSALTYCTDCTMFSLLKYQLSGLRISNLSMNQF